MPSKTPKQARTMAAAAKPQPLTAEELRELLPYPREVHAICVIRAWGITSNALAMAFRMPLGVIDSVVLDPHTWLADAMERSDPEAARVAAILERKL